MAFLSWSHSHYFHSSNSLEVPVKHFKALSAEQICLSLHGQSPQAVVTGKVNKDFPGNIPQQDYFRAHKCFFSVVVVKQRGLIENLDIRSPNTHRSRKPWEASTRSTLIPPGFPCLCYSLDFCPFTFLSTAQAIFSAFGPLLSSLGQHLPMCVAVCKYSFICIS